MLRCSSVEQVKKAAVLTVLFISVSNLHAESSAADVVEVERAAVPPVQQLQRDSRKYGDRQQNNRAVIPPPPPGPYSSSALRSLSVKVPAFARIPDKLKSNKPAFNFDSADMPMGMFSPDIPWPEDMRPRNTKAANSRSPDNNIKPFVPPRRGQAQANAANNSAMADRTAGYRVPDYNRPPNSRFQSYGPSNNTPFGPNVYWPNSRWVPSMGNGSAGPAYYMPGYNQQYRGSPRPYYNQQNYSPYNNRPMMNNYGPRSANPAANR